MMNPVPAQALTLDLVHIAIVAACHETSQTFISNNSIDHDSDSSNRPRTFRLGARNDLSAVVALLKNDADQSPNDREKFLTRDFDLVHWIVIEECNNVVGFAAVYIGYSTWDGRCLHANKICARNEETESTLLRTLADIAVRLECQRLVWQVCVASITSVA